MTRAEIWRRAPALFFLRECLLLGEWLKNAVKAGAEEFEEGEVEGELLDIGRVGAYRQRTLVGTPGASHFSQVTNTG